MKMCNQRRFKDKLWRSKEREAGVIDLDNLILFGAMSSTVVYAFMLAIGRVVFCKAFSWHRKEVKGPGF